MAAKVLPVALALVALLLSPLAAQDQQVPTAEEIERIRAALPEKPSVAPKAPRRLLLMTQCRGFVHSSVPYCAKAFELLGEKTGAFTVVVTADPRAFEPEALAGFDAVVMDNTTMKIPLVAFDLDQRPPAERLALEAQEQRLRAGLFADQTCLGRVAGDLGHRRAEFLRGRRDGAS